MQEMTATIRQNADNAFQMKQTAIHSADNAITTGATVLEMVAAMQKIEKKIVMVDDIARQTRMLSLNAMIEAAKAQEYGKGFAVVATEVRELSARSQKTAAEIAELTQIGVTLANKASDMLKRLIPDIQKTADVSQEISAASEEQSTGIQQITLAIQQLDQVTQHNSAMAEELSATAAGFTQQAARLWKTITILDRDQQEIPDSPSAPPTEQKHHKVKSLPKSDGMNEGFEKF
ncbi:MAG: methyl-accepting chemotaxis protein [Desulfococcaceae bacterium]